MNIVNHMFGRERSRRKTGSIWESSEGLYYILARVDTGMFALIALLDGNRLRAPTKSTEQATGGCTLVAEEAIITVSKR